MRIIRQVALYYSSESSFFPHQTRNPNFPPRGSFLSVNARDRFEPSYVQWPAYDRHSQKYLHIGESFRSYYLLLPSGADLKKVLAAQRAMCHCSHQLCHRLINHKRSSSGGINFDECVANSYRLNSLGKQSNFGLSDEPELGPPFLTSSRLDPE